MRASRRKRSVRLLPRRKLRFHHLEGDLAADKRIVGHEHRAHAALAEQCQDAEPGQPSQLTVGLRRTEHGQQGGRLRSRWIYGIGDAGGPALSLAAVAASWAASDACWGLRSESVPGGISGSFRQ